MTIDELEKMGHRSINTGITLILTCVINYSRHKNNCLKV